MNLTIRRKRKRPWYHSPLFLFALLLLLIIFIRAAYFSFVKKNKAQDEYEQYHQQYQELLERRDELKREIEYLQTPRGKEEEYRKQNMILEGESVIRIIEEDNN